MSNILNILRTEYESEYRMPQKQFIPPKIYHGGDAYDLSKRWYVYYSYRNPETGEMTRQPAIYMNVNRDFNTKESRLKKLKIIQKNLSELLKSGHSPYQAGDTPDQYNIVAALDWAMELKKRSLSETSISDYESRKNAFTKFLKENGYNHIMASDFKKKPVIEYLNKVSEKNSIKTRNNHQIVISSLFTVLKENEIIRDNFVQDITQQKTNSVRHKSFSTEQLANLSVEISKDAVLKLFIDIVSYNFLRPIEVVRLRWDDLKLDEKIPYLEVKAKNSPLKTKIIPEILLKEFALHKKGDPDDYVFITNNKGIDTKEVNRRNYFSDKFAKIKEKLKFGPEYTIYSFRHTYITMLFREIRKEKTEIETYDHLMKITGHTTLKALKSYLRDIDAELASDYSDYFK